MSSSQNHRPEQVESPPTYFLTSPEGTVFPLDPLNGELLCPAQIPESLLADPELSQGYDFLRQNAERIRFGLLLSRHSKAGDLAAAGIDLHSRSKELAAKNGVLFLEGTATAESREEHQRVFNWIASYKDKSIEELQREPPFQAEGPEAFTLDVLNQVAGTGVEIASPDVVMDSNRPADRALANWSKALADAYGAQGHPVEIVDNWNALNIGFVTYRDWYLVGKMGYYLAEREAAQPTPEGAEIVADMVVGSVHENIGQHIEGLGVPVEYVGGAEALERGAKNVRRVVEAVGRVALTFDDRANLLTVQ